MNDSDDPELIARLRAGDPAAFDLVYDAEKASVYGFLLRLCCDRHTAADLFQNVWLKLARHAARLRNDSNVRAWLLTVARREYIGFRRAQALDISRVLLLDLAPRTTHAGEPEADLALSAALARLADADREVLLLAASGLEPGAMAEALAVSGAAFRQRLSRARRRLAVLLETDDPCERAAPKGAG